MTDHPDISEPAEPSTAYLDITGRAVRRQVKKVQEAERARPPESRHRGGEIIGFTLAHC